MTGPTTPTPRCAPLRTRLEWLGLKQLAQLVRLTADDVDIVGTLDDEVLLPGVLGGLGGVQELHKNVQQGIEIYYDFISV